MNLNEPPTKKKKELPAEEFTAAVDSIIQRDFFPDIPALRAATDDIQLPNSNLTSQQTTTEEETTATPKARDKSLPLDAFLERYKSEDDSAFEHIVEKETKRNAKKTEWLRETEKRNQQLLIEASKRPEARLLITWPYQARNTLFYSPSEVPLTKAEQEEISLSGAQGIISHESTRQPPSLPQIQTRKIGENQETTSTSSNDNNNNDNSRSFVAMKTPAPEQSPIITWGKVIGTPIQLQTPLRVDGNGSSASTTNVFKIPELPNRDQVGMKLADNARANANTRNLAGRKKSSVEFMSPIGRSTSLLLTPAGKTLLSSRLNSSNSSCYLSTSSGNVDTQLRASYSPHPITVKCEPSSSSSILPNINANTPSAFSASSTPISISQQPTLIDPSKIASSLASQKRKRKRK